MKKKFVTAFIDSIENEMGIIYFGENEDYKVNIPIKYLPINVKEGDILKISIDKDKVEEKREEVERLRNKLID